MKEFIKKSFKRELLACFLVVALLPLIISSTFLVQLFKVKLDNDNQKKDLEQAQQIDAKLTTLFDNFEFVAGELAKDEEIRAALKAEGTKTRSEVYSRLYGETVSLREQRMKFRKNSRKKQRPNLFRKRKWKFCPQKKPKQKIHQTSRLNRNHHKKSRCRSTKKIGNGFFHLIGKGSDCLA